MATVWDKMFGRAKAADNVEEFKTAMKDYVDPDHVPAGGDDGDTHIHLHMNGKGDKGGGMDEDPGIDPSGDPDPGEPDPQDLGAQVAALTQRVDQLEAMLSDEEDVELEGENEDGTKDARRFKLRRGAKLTRDEDKEDYLPERNPDMISETDLPGIEDLDKRMPTLKAGDRRRFRDKYVRTHDSADQEDIWSETMALAEIIEPGIKVPTFDARLPMARTAERLCAFRRRVLDHAMKDDNTREVLSNVVGTINPTVLPCDSVKLAFQAVGMHMRTMNNAHVTQVAVRDGAGAYRASGSAPPSIADMNKQAKEFWAARKTNGSTRAY